MSWKKNGVPLVEIREFMVRRRGSVNPKKFLDETFQLYSIPAYDVGNPETLKGIEIGSSKKIIQNNDILLSRIVPHIRRCWVINDDTEHRKIGSGEWIIFNSEKVDPRYLKYFFFSDIFDLHFLKDLRGVGGSLLRANPELTGKIKIPLPPLPTQHRIADLLDKADALRRKDQELLAYYEWLEQSVFLEMFGDPVKNEKGWDVDNFGSFCEEMRYGTNAKSDYSRSSGDTPVVRIPNILKNKVNFDDVKYAILGAKEKNKLMLKKGDLLFVRSNGNPNYIGRCAVFEDDMEAVNASYLIKVRLFQKSKILPNFAQFSFSLPSYRRRILKIARTTAGNYNMNTVGLKGLKLIIPPLHLQNQFATIIKNINLQKEKVEANIEKSEALFQCLLQKAFKGELFSE